MRQTALALLGLICGGGLALAAPPDASKVTELIDGQVAAVLKDKKVKPAPLVDDAAFLRRVYLDLTGTIPPLTEVRDFIDDSDKDKRRKLVQKLLASDDHAAWQASLWAKMIVKGQDRFGQQTGPLTAWFKDNVKKNAGYDQLVKQIVTGSPQTATFETINEFLPENLAASTTRLFLGVKMECAQCHDHPFAPYKKTQFWEQAAFFSGVARLRQPQGGAPEAGAITIPGTDKKVKATFLDGNAAPMEKGKDPRAILAEWVVRDDNPYFAKASVNRVWAQYMGLGLVDPVDEFSAENPASHPKLLDELAKDFAASGFDVRRLTEGILLSQAYQRSSEQTDASQADVRTYGRRALRGLSPAQLFDSLMVVSDNSAGRGEQGNPQFGQQNTPRAEFLGRFPDQDRAVDSQTSILQALYLMNGPIVSRITQVKNNHLLEVLEKRVKDHPEECVEELYILTLSRLPREAEKARMVKYLQQDDVGKALGDVLWVLLNSSEFYVYH